MGTLISVCTASKHAKVAIAGTSGPSTMPCHASASGQKLVSVAVMAWHVASTVTSGKLFAMPELWVYERRVVRSGALATRLSDGK